MPKIYRERVADVLIEGYNFEMGDYLSEGFEIYKKEWLMFSLYGLVSIFLLFISAITIVGILFTAYPIMLGYAVAADKVSRSENLEFSDFFGGFKNFGSHAMVTILIVAAYLIVYIPFLGSIFMSGLNGGGDDLYYNLIGAFGSLYVMIGVLFIYFLMLGFFFAPYLIHYGNYSGGEAIRASFKIVFKNFWWLLLFLIITGILGAVGQYACLIGLIFTLPISALMNYSLVKKVLMSDDAHEIDQIGE